MKLDEKQIDKYIERHLPVKIDKKNKYGEVFTPPVLINKLLDLLPRHVWLNPEFKWLDPAAGAGFFMIFVYRRLMDGLKEWQPDAGKRGRHIIERMMYMVEINKTNCRLCSSLFGPKANIICQDFLSFENKFGAFDCIVGNPPFQDDYGLTEMGKRIQGGKSKLYERIFLKSYELLKTGGWLTFVVPDNLFSGNSSNAYKTLIQNEVPFVSFNSANQDYFPGIQQVICYFILRKREEIGIAGGFTEIENDTNKIKIRLQDRPVNPIRNWTIETERLVSRFVSCKRNNVIYNRGKNIADYKGSKYPIVYTPDKMLYTNDANLAIGLKQKKAILFAISTELAFKMDYSGAMGAGPNTFVVPFNTHAEGKLLEQFLISEAYKKLVYATKTNRQYLKIALIEHLKLTNILKRVKTVKKTVIKRVKTRRIRSRN